MDDQDLVPEIFGSLVEQRKKAESVTPDILARYCDQLKNKPDFLSELITVIGQDKLLILVREYGGIKLDIPYPSDILSKVAKNDG